MAQSSWPDPAASRAVNDTQYEELVAPQYVDGQVGSPTDTPLVYADGSGRQVAILANRTAQLRGHGWSSGATDTVLSIAANSSGSTRTDLVVLGLSRTTWAVTAYVKTGTPGSGAPALQTDTGTTGIYEMPLAEVTVGTGVSTITADKVKPRAWWTLPDGAASAGTDTRPPSPTPGMRLWEAGVAYVWNGTTWERVSSPLAPVQSSQVSDLDGTAITGDSTWRDFSSGVWASASIVIPQTGRLKVTVSGWIENRLTTTSTIWLGYRAAGGGMFPGTLADTMNARSISTRSSRVVAGRTRLFTGLTPGATTTITPAYYSSAVSSDSTVSTIKYGNLILEPA